MYLYFFRRRSSKFLCIASIAFSHLGAPSVQAANDVPQIILTENVVQRIEHQRPKNPQVEADFQALIAAAEAVLKKPKFIDEFKKNNAGEPILPPGFGHKLVERMTTLGMAWRMTGNRHYAQRGRTELLEFAHLDNWNPEHFLGLSRITVAVVLGYSWMSDTLDESEHEVIKSALFHNALNEGTKIYDLDKNYFDHGWVVPQLWLHPTPVPRTLPDGTATADISWPVASFNWNIICNAGMILAALAVSASEPELANSVIQQAQLSLRNGFSVFAPDGAWSEGPMYGALSARDAAVLVNALESVLGHDFDLSNAAGMPVFGNYLMHVSGPTGLLFNYGDSDTKTDLAALPWLSERFARPTYDWRNGGADHSSLPALNLIWRKNDGLDPALREATSYWFSGLGLVTMRSAWSDPNATFIGFKAGRLRSHHNNLDAGTFVIDAKGVRWAVDLGLGNYNLPGYFTDARFDYYRTATIGQNTLSFDEANQNPNGRAQIEDFGQFPNFDFAIADLSNTYDAAPGSVRRGIALIGGETVLIQDEITHAKSGQLTWTMHTEADVTLEGSRATLKQNGEEMTAVILSPPDGRFKLRTANPCDTSFKADCAQQNPNKGIQRLMIELDPSAGTGESRITVVISSSPSRIEALIPQLKPLSDWRLNATLSHKNKHHED